MTNMKINSRNIQASVLTIVVLVIVGLALGASKKETTGIKIGFIGPLSGETATWGEEQKEAVEIAVAEANAKSPNKMSVTYEDGKCDGKEAVSAAQKLLAYDKPDVLVAICSAEVLAIAPIAQQAKTVLIGMWTTNPSVSQAGDYVFRVSYSDKDTARVMAETIAQKYQKVGILTELTEYSVGVRDAFKDYFKGQIIEEGYPVDSNEVRTPILKLVAQSPEVIIINPNAPKAGLSALQTLKELGYKGQIYGNYFGGTSAVIAAPEAEGMIFLADPDVPENTISTSFVEKFKAGFGRAAEYPFAAAASYDTIRILDQATDKVGKDSEALKRYLNDLTDFNGALGIYSFDDNGDVVGVNPALKQIKNKAVVNYQP